MKFSFRTDIYLVFATAIATPVAIGGACPRLRYLAPGTVRLVRELWLQSIVAGAALE